MRGGEGSGAANKEKRRESTGQTTSTDNSVKSQRGLLSSMKIVSRMQDVCIDALHRTLPSCCGCESGAKVGLDCARASSWLRRGATAHCAHKQVAATSFARVACRFSARYVRCRIVLTSWGRMPWRERGRVSATSVRAMVCLGQAWRARHRRTFDYGRLQRLGSAGSRVRRRWCGDGSTRACTLRVVASGRKRVFRPCRRGRVPSRGH